MGAHAGAVEYLRSEHASVAELAEWTREQVLAESGSVDGTPTSPVIRKYVQQAIAQRLLR